MEDDPPEGRPTRRAAVEIVLALATSDRTDPALARSLAAGRR